MMNTAETIGYVATVLLVISFLPRQIKHIRLINFFACMVFVIYGIMLGFKWPIIIGNSSIALIQLYYLFFNNKTIKEKQA